MPELPEVEEAAGRLRRCAVGRTIAALAAHHPSQRRQLSRRQARRAAGRRVEAVERRGKHQLVHLDDGAVLHVHFRMDGDWVLGRVGDPLARAARVTIDLDDGVRVALEDPRALCTISYHPPGRPPRLVLGPEADDPALTSSVLRHALGQRRGAIKSVLLDQKLIAGVGNIYAGESLWRAGIHPAVRASAIGHVRATRLLAGIRAALADGVVNAGRYRAGERVIPLDVYDREGEDCGRCGGTIRRIVQSGRSTYFCPDCQRR
jgi:formamidopyrimidine-DNA glycosylase